VRDMRTRLDAEMRDVLNDDASSNVDTKSIRVHALLRLRPESDIIVMLVLSGYCL